MKNLRRVWGMLGAGLLYAGAAVGVSHLVQSTRAGAEYGGALLWAVLAANVAKYPFFAFGPRYAIATGRSLLEGYWRLGKWAYGIFMAITVGTMFTIQAAVTLVTAGLLGLGLGGGGEVNLYAFGLLLGSAALLIGGGFDWLNRTMKGIILTLTVATMVALAAAAFHFRPEQIQVAKAFDWQNPEDITFLIALMGWMPAPIDLAVWHSVWTLEAKQENPALTPAAVALDFEVGYWGTTVLAVMFLGLGALSLYGRGETLPNQSIPFAAKLLTLYTQNIGAWSFPVIAIAAFATMWSTTLTVLDAYARTTLNGLMLVWPALGTAPPRQQKRWFAGLVILTLVGAQGILTFAVGSMRSLIEFATIVSFVTAPVLAGLNFWVMNREDVPPAFRPNRWETGLAGLGGLFLVGFTGIYLRSLGSF